MFQELKIIIYKENDIAVTLEIKDNIVKINRLSKDYEINLTFNAFESTISTCSVFGTSKILELKTKTNKLSIKDNEIEIEYILEGNKFLYKLTMGG